MEVLELQGKVEKLDLAKKAGFELKEQELDKMKLVLKELEGEVKSLKMEAYES